MIKEISYILAKSFYDIFKILFRNWHIRKLFRISGLLKLLLVYIFTLAWIISFEIEYSENFWTKAIKGNFSKNRFSFYGTQGRIGEGVLYDRIKHSADKLGYDYSAIKFSEQLSHFWLTSHFYYVSTSIVNLIFNPKFNLTLTHHVRVIPFGYNITYLNMPLDSLYTHNDRFMNYWSHLNDYDAYADLYSIVHKENKLLQTIIANSGKPKKIIPLYLAQDAKDFSYLPMDQGALLTGTLWGCNRNSLRITQALKKLGKERILTGIGLEEYLGFLGKAYLGRMEQFANPLIAISDVQRKYGIALIIHNQEHMLDGIPTSRIAEAAAVGALIISDRNEFLVKIFGDNILYFDAFANNEEIYLQIKNHINWAMENPEEAHIKAQNTYNIFKDNFTMTKQLNSLFNDMHSKNK